VRKLTGSLFLRLAMLVLVAVVATQLFTWWMVAGERREMVAKGLYSHVIDTLADIEGHLDPLNATERAAYLATYNRPGMMQILPGNADRSLAFSPSLTPLARAFSEQLSRGLGEPAVIKMRVLETSSQLWVSVRLLGSRYWLVIPHSRFHENQLTSATLATLFASLTAIMVAFTIAWRVSKPISQVVDAAHTLERGHSPKPVPEHSGPREVRGLTESFNRMARALQTAASERRLMLAGLSHDLRTPLTRLKLMVEMQETNPDKQDMLDDIDELSRIVRQFIDFARSEEVPRREPVALAELASSVVSRFNREAMEIKMTPLAEPEIPADALALERLLSNLLENARRYGRAPFEVTVSETSHDAVLSVTDHGDGIPMESRSAALAPFERLAAHRGTDGGSGLGLAIVERIVKQHNGHLSFKDVDGGGLKVVIRLPRAEQGV
jgi:two-component system osmolarity sensor histidine kinase EnvZ